MEKAHLTAKIKERAVLVGIINQEQTIAQTKEYLDELTPIIREAYIPYASTVLGLQVTFFGQAPLNKKVEKPKIRVDETKDDIGQLSIIKTLSEERNLIDQVASVIEPSMFGQYNTLLTSVIQNQENSALTGLLFDENIKTMSEEELKKALASFLFKYYTQKLKDITLDTSIPLIKKSFLIRKIKIDILPRLKRGELVTYRF